MWIVYKLTFEESDKYYIGVTNNLSKRIMNHKNGSIRNNKTKKEKWIKSHLDRGHNLNYEILFTYQDSRDAYSKENELLEELIKDSKCMNGTTGGIGGISSIRTQEVVDKFKRSMSKNYVFIKDGKVIPVRNANEFARSLGLTSHAFQETAKGKFYACKGYRVFYLKDWLALDINQRATVVKFSYNLYHLRKVKVIWKDNTEPSYL